MSISLIGVGLDHEQYQIGMIHFSYSFSFPDGTSNFKPALALALCRKSDGKLLLASDMPVNIKPGWLLQGKKDKYGDKGVFHAKATGEVVPLEVQTTLGSALGRHPSYPSMCMFLNNPDPLKNKFFTARSSTYSTLTRWRFNWTDKHEFDQVYNSITYGGTCYLETVGSNYHFHLEATGYYQQIIADCYFPITGIDWCQGSRPTTIATGSSAIAKRTLHPTGSWQYANSSTNSWISFQAFSAPVYLDSITSQIVFAGTADGSINQINADLLDLSSVDPGNAPWLSCYNSVEACKTINFQWAAYIKDSLDIKSLIKPLKKFSLTAKPKQWADLYLWWIYGIKPQVSDTKRLTEQLYSALHGKSIFEVAEAFSALGTTYGTSYHTGDFIGNTVTIKCNARTCLRPRIQPVNKVDTLFLFLQSLDIGLDATNIWEILPYSFVVDWFINSDEYARWIKYKSFPTLYDLKQLISSVKRSTRVSSSRYLEGSDTFVSLSTYNRDLHTTFPKQPFDLSFNDPSGHWLEGGALLVSKFF